MRLDSPDQEQSRGMMTLEEKLHVALRENNRHAIEELVLKSGVSVNCLYYGMTPLLVAIAKGYTEAAIWLLKNGADASIPDVNGTSAFEQAVIRNQVQVVKHLAACGIYLNGKLSSGHTALTFAAQKKLTALTQVLVEAGADVNQTNKNGETPLFICAHEGNASVMEYLLKANVEKDLACGREQLTPLMAAVVNDRMSTARFLINAGCNLDYCDASGWTALWHALSDHNEPLVKLLLSSGADATVTDAEGRTLLDEAAEQEMEDIVKMLETKSRVF